MTSPKQITKLALIVATTSILGIIVKALLRPDWGILTWWPAMGLGLAVILLIISYLRGAYLAAQQRAEMVDMLNDCYMGVAQEETDLG